MVHDKRSRRRELRDFGVILAAGIMLLFGALFPWLGDRATPEWVLIAGGTIYLLAMILPITLFPVHWLWMKLGAGLGWINTRILLTIIFYLIILPAGLIMRLFGKDPMARRFDAGAQSYRIPSKPIPSEKLENPF